MTITTTCPNLACGISVEVDYFPGSPPKAYGPPDRCDPGSDDDCDPSTCPECGADLDMAKIEAKAAEVANDAKLEREISRAEWRSMCRGTDY